MALEDLLTARWEDLMTGRTKPHELPEFQSMRAMLESAGAKSRAGTARQMRVQGIKGPAVGLTLQKQEEGQLAPMGTAIGTTLADLPERAGAFSMGKKGLDIQEMLGVGQLREARKGRHLQESMGKQPCILTTVCYGEDSIEVALARDCRDATVHHPVVRRIVRGYYVFSDLLLPLMKFNIIKKVVKHALIEPLMFALIRYKGYNVKPWRMPFDSVVAHISLNLWRIMGSRGPYTRRSGEVV